jgi:hypothetical protein
VATAGLEEAASLKGKIAPSAIITEGGAKIGLVGATTQILESISSPSGTKVKDNDSVRSDDMDLLAAQLQPVINDLIAQGVNKIILMSHLQVLANEKLLATKLQGVDIILAAGSNTRLGDANDTAVAFAGHDANFADTYPLVIKDKDGKNTLVANTDNEFTYLGRLVVDFDANGDILPASINPAISGAYASYMPLSYQLLLSVYPYTQMPPLTAGVTYPKSSSVVCVPTRLISACASGVNSSLMSLYTSLTFFSSSLLSGAPASPSTQQPPLHFSRLQTNSSSSISSLIKISSMIIILSILVC